MTTTEGASDPRQLYRPPAPVPRAAVPSLFRLLWRRQKDLLSLLPDVAYREMVTPLGQSRRGILLINDPEWVGRILADHDLFPKNDLFVEALEDLVGNSMFVTSGDTWRRQRRMVDPAFSHMRINHAFDFMVGAVDDYEARLDALSASGETFSLDAAMSHLTADVITRTIFSVPLAGQTSHDVFEDFMKFERQVGSIDIKRLLWDKPWSAHTQPDAAKPEENAARILTTARTFGVIDCSLVPPNGFALQRRSAARERVTHLRPSSERHGVRCKRELDGANSTTK